MSGRERLWRMLDGEERPWYSKAMSCVIVASLVPLCFKDPPPALEAVEYVCVLVFVADYAMRLATADFKLGRGAASFLLYPFTPMALVDLVSILPTFVMLNPAFRALRLLRLVRVLRAFRLLRYSRSVQMIGDVFREQARLLVTVVALACAYILISALVVFNAEPETFDTFFDAVYWAVVSLTTVGYGDIYPVSVAGRVLAMASAFVGIAVVALPAGILTAGFMERMEKKDE